MKIGKQSTLNDLSDLKSHLEAKIEEAKAIRVDDVSQIESGNIVGGDDVFADRATGAYHVSQDSRDSGGGGVAGITDDPDLAGLNVQKNGMLLHLRPPFNSAFSAAFLLQWDGTLNLFLKQQYEKKRVTVLTKQNTITDANGFIKAA